MNLITDSSWTLFLDRDGVINVRIPDDYIRTPEQFEFIPGTLEALKTFASSFSRIIVVTNQQGIGKGLMNEEMLHTVHKHMLDQVQSAGGRIDRIFYSPYLCSRQHVSRKPGIGMALQARAEYRSINFRKSIMAGDSLSDLIFGRRMGMTTVLIGPPDIARKNPDYADYNFPDLLTFAEEIKANSP